MTLIESPALDRRSYHETAPTTRGADAKESFRIAAQVAPLFEVSP